MRPGDGLLPFELLVTVSIALIVVAFHYGKGSEEITAKNEKAAAEQKADLKPEDAVWLRMPLECEQWIAMRGAGEQWKRRPVCADFTKEKK